MELAAQEQLEREIVRLENEIRFLKSELKGRHKLEEQLLRAQKMEALAALSGGIAHDFNNILHCILGYTEWALLKRYESSPDYEPLNQIVSMVKKGKHLARQLLAFGRKMDARLEILNFNSILKNVEKILQRTIPRMIDIELQLDDNLKNIAADAGQCEQILMNLCINAKDSMPEGGKLTLKTENVCLNGGPDSAHIDLPSGDYIRLTIADTGHGISEDTLTHIYKPFFTTKAKGKGTGLGLSMVHAIVQNYNGAIECSSNPGAGTTFRIYLPPAVAVTDFVQSESRQQLSKISRGHEVVLIVDDEADIINISQKILEESGYTVITARSGEEGIAKYLQNQIDLVLLDVSMPGIGGVKCLRHIMSLSSKAKVIIISGYLLSGQIEEAMTLGAKAFLTKPFSFEELRTTVRNVLEQNLN
ncbi:MAG: response regulator [Desulfobacterales bacterium]|jgi:signal transduction histidine kinase/ActR/RegA family two-component response regulator